MTKYFLGLMVLLIVVLSGCDINNYAKIGDGFELYYTDYSEIETIDDIAPWICDRVTYRSDDSVYGEDTFQSPKTTLESGYGDCEDFSLVWINIAFIKFGIKADLPMVLMETLPEPMQKTRVNGGSFDHVMVYYNGLVYEPQNDCVYENVTIEYIYTFDELFILYM